MLPRKVGLHKTEWKKRPFTKKTLQRTGGAGLVAGWLEGKGPPNFPRAIGSSDLAKKPSSGPCSLAFKQTHPSIP